MGAAAGHPSYPLILNLLKDGSEGREGAGMTVKMQQPPPTVIPA